MSTGDALNCLLCLAIVGLASYGRRPSLIAASWVFLLGLVWWLLFWTKYSPANFLHSYGFTAPPEMVLPALWSLSDAIACFFFGIVFIQTAVFSGVLSGLREAWWSVGIASLIGIQLMSHDMFRAGLYSGWAPYLEYLNIAWQAQAAILFVAAGHSSIDRLNGGTWREAVA